MHPPLYYLLATPFFLFDHLTSQKVTQFLSLLLSAGNLYILYLLARKLFSDVLVRNISFLLAIFLHSYVTFSLYVSNDTLTFFIGSLLFLLLHRYIYKPTQSNEVALAVVMGLGLLTKGTFLAFGPVLGMVVLLSLWKKETATRIIVFRLLVFGFLSLSIGSYKYIENYYAEGRPIVHNIDFFQYMPADTYVGLKSIYYFNLKRLVRNPTFFQGDPFLEHVYPIIFYATFWYKFSEPFNGFELGSRTSFKYIGSLIYLVGLVPSLLIILGFLKKSVSSVRFLRTMKESSDSLFAKKLEEGAWLSILLLSVILVIIAGLKYNVWVCFQSRLFLQAFFSVMWLLYVGLKAVRKTSSLLFYAGSASILLVSFLYLVYYLTEGIHLLS
ncbi:ArnT family glycosyltransferase [Telluribacter sp.]|jgi:4-amino-4-deoxy-L-arabinose transferase-like glycosyltransferase|uniref:ArnT family glycosyltransferase n=1 Tax=Telluribacter sp. TaxID=1978767 RepID=UPI002E1053D2|nr:glycosyltransferase family 39 protein [Telluribacter sp.]